MSIQERPTDVERQQDLSQARSRHSAEVASRKAMARRAWEGGEATVKEIAAAARADPKTVRRWAVDGGWSGGPAHRTAAPPTASEIGLDSLNHALRHIRSGLLREEDDGR